MAELEKDIQERMNNVAYRYAGRLRQNIKQVLSQPKYRASGMLESSIQVSVEEATGYKPPNINIQFVGYGDFIGKRKLLWTKVPPIEDLKVWVELRGRDDGSAPVPGYKNGAPNLPSFKRAERIAYAIAVTKRRDDKFKRQPWKKESLPSVLKEMNAETYAQFGDHIEKLLAEAISKGL